MCGRCQGLWPHVGARDGIVEGTQCDVVLLEQALADAVPARAQEVRHARNVGACPAEGQLNCGVVDLRQAFVKVAQQP